MKFFYTNVRRQGNNLLVIGYDKQTKKRIQTRVPYQPCLYVESNIDEATEFYGIYGEKLQKRSFDSMSECSKYVKDYSGLQNIFGSTRYEARWISETFKGIEVPYEKDSIRIQSIDIETWSGNGFPKPTNDSDRITVITVFDTATMSYYVFGENFSPGGKVDISKLKSDYPIIYNEYSSESELLLGFLDFWSKNPPDVLTGWYSRFFDIPYIIERLEYILGESQKNRFSPWKKIEKKVKNVKRQGKFSEEISYDIFGISELDYQDLYKKYSQGSRESYSLDFIAEHELGETKLKFDGTLHELYESDYHTYVQYNIQDVGLIVRLEEKLKYLELIIDVAYSGKSPRYDDALGTVKYWEILIAAHLEESNIFSPLKDSTSGEDVGQYTGAFVKDPVVGRHKWVVNFDFKSLYPTLIRQVNIGPESILKDTEIPDELQSFLQTVSVEAVLANKINTELLKKYDVSLSANGKLYRRNKQTFLSELMEKFFNKRVVYKGLMKDNKKLHENVKIEMKKRGLL